MAVIVNNPPTSDTSGSNGLVIAVVLILLFILAIYFGLPILRRAATPTQVNVPDKVDVNVNTPNNGQ